MNKHHSEIIENIENNAGKAGEEIAWVKKYMGTNKIFYCLKSKTKKKIAKDWIKSHPNISLSDYIGLLDYLFAGKSHEEICVASLLLQFLPKLRKQLKPQSLDKWLANACGWGEIDSICQSNFSAEELLNDWKSWKILILKFSKDNNVSKRRASLVLLTKPTRTSENSKLADLAFDNIDKLKSEKNILITKAISWLLRSLLSHHPEKVKSYLKKNKATLPKIAIRETRSKLLTGKK
jgi:3-methyladenine DNA glycosylase AlkD